MYKPPSEKLSGVKFNIPIIEGLEKFIFFKKFLLFEVIFFISFLTFFLAAPLIELIFFIPITFREVPLEFLVINSILSNEISLLPHKGKANFFNKFF